MATDTNYNNEDLTINKMVRNRLTFLNTGEPAESQINGFILEIMAELEPCLRVTLFDWNNTQGSSESTTPPWDPSPSSAKLGREEFYTIAMRSLIADLAAVYMLLLTAAYNTSQGGSGSGSSSTYLKKAKADVVEVEWGQLDAAVAGGLSSLKATTDGLIKLYTDSANRRAAKLGCVLAICDPCKEGATVDQRGVVFGAMPFIVVRDCGCC